MPSLPPTSGAPRPRSSRTRPTPPRPHAGRATLALSGGTTLAAMLTELATRPLPNDPDTAADRCATLLRAHAANTAATGG